MGPYEHVEAWAVWQQGRAPQMVWRDVGGQL